MDASAVISATKWIGSLLIDKGNYLYDVEDQVRGLQDELECMLCLLQQSDLTLQHDHQFPEGDLQLAIFTKKIRQIAFRSEDVIDTYILKVASTAQGITFLTRCACFLSKSPLIHQTGNQIGVIIKEVKEASERLNRYRVVPITINEGRSSVVVDTYAHTEDEIVIGFDDHIKDLVEQLTDENKSWVIGIVGTGGSGKSTLARKVFHHIDITSYFKHKAWVSISQQWSRRDVIYEILRNTRGVNKNEKDYYWTDRELVEKLYNFLKVEERYLIVLDDTWERKAWDDIRDAIPRNNKGSKVIITTRIQRVPLYADPTCFILEPRLLDNEKAWELFSKIAMPMGIDMEILGKKMVGKCGGLPLAIVTLSGLLRSDDWEHIDKACGDNILEYGSVDKIIALSYLHLPPHLKPCFLYLAVFPKDTEIPGGLLTKLWIAEGLVTQGQQRGQENLEDVAKRCVDELVRRCILQVLVRRSYSRIAKEYRLHDLLRDFCIVNAKDQNFLEVFSSKDDYEGAFDAKVSSLQSRRATFHSRMSLPLQNSHLRSLIRFGNSGPYIVGNIHLYETVKMSMDPMYKNFKLLRVLNLWGIETSSGKLSDEIGNLIHLRYLAIKATNITMFPKAIENLRNLLTLDFRYNKGKGKIAFTLSNLIQMRHLYLGWNTEISTENLGLDKLKDLQTLKSVSAGKWMIKEIGRLSKCIKKLQIHKMYSTQQLESVYRCPSIMFDSLQMLYLDWLDNDQLKLDLEKLEKCKHLKKLTLDGRINEDMNSMVKPLQFPPHLVCLELWRSHLRGQDCITKTIGQLSYLKFLRLGPDSYEGAQLNLNTVGAFPQLESLMLHCLPNLEECRIEEATFVCLRHLSIIVCPKLRCLPEKLTTITTLEDILVVGMAPTFCKRLGWEEDDGVNLTIRNTSRSSSSSNTTVEDGKVSKQRLGEDFHIIRHIPTIEIRDVR